MRPDMTVAEVFNAAAAAFDVWTPLLWDRFGAATVTLADPQPGDRVLDACCGTGSAALPAARAVGPLGRVDAVDVAGRLIDAGRARAATEGVRRIDFHVDDVSAWMPADKTHYDVVVCVFGVFFFVDMDKGGAHLLSVLRPGGRIAVTTWAHGAVEPLVRPFVEAVTAELGSAGYPSPGSGSEILQRSSARVDHAAGLQQWLRDIGAVGVEVGEMTVRIPLTPELAWAFCTGAGPRALLSGLGPDAVARVRGRYFDALAEKHVDVFDARALIGQGTAPYRPSFSTQRDVL
jgi:ubiquinone/menaquinone biosynthesis C-methylase UbiE